ncbi:MAG: hypothetical protein COB77_04945 [Gammaproteobacteria bacterium]|nr:MAG: hypothetical protein COB77_04945 [Gammaproteobacteria bacterium]
MKDAADLGVSWHRVVHEFDAGDILIQKKIVVDEGATYVEIKTQLAAKGAEMVQSLLIDIENGTGDILAGNIQNAARASYFPHPDRYDFVINTQGSAQQAYNYMCATQNFGYAYQCQTGKHCFYLEQALDYDNNITLDTVEVHQNKLYIPFKEGVLFATYTDKIST